VETGGTAGGGEAAGVGDGAGGGGAFEGGACAGGAGAEAGRAGMGTNSPGFHVCGIRRIEGSLRNRSACPQTRHSRVPRESSPPERIESVPRPIVPVRSSFAQTKSLAPQLLQTGAKDDT